MVAMPPPVTVPPLLLISLFAMWPVMIATMEPRKGRTVQPAMPAIRLTRAMVLLRVIGGIA